MQNILIPALSLGGIAVFLGALLAVASVLFKVEEDDRITRITDILPGANCGGCGFAGCSSYAAAIVNDDKPISCCSVGGQKVQNGIAEIMGVEPGAFVEKKSMVMCGGTCSTAQQKFTYSGIHDCVAANSVGGGMKKCGYGCLGLGTCVSVCKFDAIKIENGVAVIDQSKCTACGTCAASCPRGLIVLKPVANNVYVKCKSCDKGAVVKSYCSSGCLGCKLCEKVCPAGAISVETGVAEINYEKCLKCGKCAEKCPAKCIQIGA